MPHDHRIEVSATEVPQFRRLVQFVAEVSVHADAVGDVELQQMVGAMRNDLLVMIGEPPEGFHD